MLELQRSLLSNKNILISVFCLAKLSKFNLGPCFQNLYFLDMMTKILLAPIFSLNTPQRCGPGLYTTHLSERGARVAGIDFSENSLNFARQVAEEKGLDIDYVHGNYLHFETEKRFDLIIMMMCDFCALSPEQRSILLSKFRSLLKQGGSVLLDVYTLNSFAQRQESASHELNQMNGFCIKEIFADVAGQPYHPDSAEMAITAGTT